MFIFASHNVVVGDARLYNASWLHARAGSSSPSRSRMSSLQGRYVMQLLGVSVRLTYAFDAFVGLSLRIELTTPHRR